MTKTATRPGKRAPAAPAPVPAAVAAPPPPLATDDRITVTVAEACRLVSLSRTTIELLIKEGRLSDCKIGRLRGRLIRVDELRALVAPTIAKQTEAA